MFGRLNGEESRSDVVSHALAEIAKGRPASDPEHPEGIAIERLSLERACDEGPREPAAHSRRLRQVCQREHLGGLGIRAVDERRGAREVIREREPAKLLRVELAMVVATDHAARIRRPCGWRFLRVITESLLAAAKIAGIAISD